MTKRQFRVVGREQRLIGEREHTVFDRKFKTHEEAEAVAYEIARRLSDIYGYSHAEIYDLFDDDADIEVIYADYDASASPDLTEFDVAKFLAARKEVK